MQSMVTYDVAIRVIRDNLSKIIKESHKLRKDVNFPNV